MSIFFDFKTINELMGDNYYRQPKEFTLEDLSQYNGSNGVVDIFTNAPKAGFLIDDDYMSDMNNMNLGSTMPTNRQVKQDTSKFTPDDWIRYIDPLVTYALRETTQGMNTQRAYQKFILLGVLVGLGKTPQEAINQVQEWQNTGASQLLKSGAGGIGTGGSGGIGMGGSTGTSGGTMPTNRQIKQDTSKFTPDDWIRYIAPLVTYALRETTQGMNTQRAYQKFILLGVLVGLGKTPQEAINQVQEWQNTGASQLLKSGASTSGGMSTGGSGGIGTGGIGTGTSGNIGIGGSTGTGGSGGIGTAGIGTGTSGGMSIGGSTGTGGSVGIGTGGIGTSDGTMPTKQDTSKFTPDDWIRYIAPLVTYALRETTQGMNTQRAYQKFILLGVLVGLGKTPQEAIDQVQEWQNTGASQLLKSGISTGSAGTSGSIGAGGIGTGTGTIGSGGIGIGGSTGTSGNTNRRNRLHFD